MIGQKVDWIWGVGFIHFDSYYEELKENQVKTIIGRTSIDWVVNNNNLINVSRKIFS